MPLALGIFLAVYIGMELGRWRGPRIDRTFAPASPGILSLRPASRAARPPLSIATLGLHLRLE